MKKQILFIAFLITTVFIEKKSYAQDLDYLDASPTYCVPALPLSCATGDALHPVPGVSYPYTITATNAGTVHWFVTDNNSVMASGAIVGASDAGDGNGAYILSSDNVYNNPANNSLTIDLTWKSFDGINNDVLLVAFVTDAATCTNNIEVFRIEPRYSFTLDIAGLLDDGTSGASECVSPVVSAQYDGTNLTMDYGANTVFYTVNAANWQTSWQPTFTLNYTGGSTPSIVEWAYPDEASGAGSVWHAATDQVEASHYGAANGFVGSTGQCIVLRVTLTHGGNEIAAAGETVNVIVNGEMLNPETAAYDGAYPDLEEGTPDCISDLTTDNANYTITPRPDLNENTPTPFEPKN